MNPIHPSYYDIINRFFDDSRERHEKDVKVPGKITIAEAMQRAIDNNANTFVYEKRGRYYWFGEWEVEYQGRFGKGPPESLSAVLHSDLYSQVGLPWEKRRKVYYGTGEPYDTSWVEGIPMRPSDRVDSMAARSRDKFLDMVW